MVRVENWFEIRQDLLRRLFLNICFAEMFVLPAARYKQMTNSSMQLLNVEWSDKDWCEWVSRDEMV